MDVDYISSRIFGGETPKKRKPQVKGARVAKQNKNIRNGDHLNNVNNQHDAAACACNTDTHKNNNYELAKHQSLGFFDDITEPHWELMRDRVRKRVNHCTNPINYCPQNPNQPLLEGKSGDWYQDNWEPDFTCLHERRIGGMGDGPKWVCDPHRIASDSGNAADGCLVYSVGSNGVFGFEEAVLKDISSNCEIHTFDPELQGADFSSIAPDGVHYHAWGIEDKGNAKSKTMPLEPGAFKTLQQTVQELGHAGRTVDIFKIDCEGCEWMTFDDWFDADVMLRQILVEVHGVNKHGNMDNFFQKMQEEGYVTFHKEPNIKYSYSNFFAVEYAMLKLDASFYDGMDLQVEEFPPATRPPSDNFNWEYNEEIVAADAVGGKRVNGDEETSSKKIGWKFGW